jgi:hypothetical protein
MSRNWNGSEYGEPALREKAMTIQQALADEVRGHTKLWVVFWIYGVLVSHVFFGTILYFYRQVETPVLATMLIGFLAYSALIMRAVWVNAFNADNELYSHIARALTVVWSLNAVMVSVFLFLGRLGTVTVPI